MKSTILLVAIFFCGLALHAQESYDTRLEAKYSKEQLAKLQENESQAIDYWTYYLDNSYEIVDVIPGKSAEGYEEIKIKNIDSFNILELGIEMDRSTNKYYQIKGTNQMLVLLSNEKFVEKYNSNRSQQ